MLVLVSERTCQTVHARLSQDIHETVQSFHLKPVGRVRGQTVDGAHDGVLTEGAEHRWIWGVPRRRCESVRGRTGVFVPFQHGALRCDRVHADDQDAS